MEYCSLVFDKMNRRVKPQNIYFQQKYRTCKKKRASRKKQGLVNVGDCGGISREPMKSQKS